MSNQLIRLQCSELQIELINHMNLLFFFFQHIKYRIIPKIITLDTSTSITK